MRELVGLVAITLFSAPASAFSDDPVASPNPPMIFASPASVQPTVPCARGCFDPIEAVTYASSVGERGGVAGEFSVPIKGAGERDGRLYLNSEADYRDRNCLTVAIPLGVANAIFGTTELDAIRQRLLGKRIVVAGIAHQVRIDFTQDGKPTGKYYYQVHVGISTPQQVLQLPAV